LHNSWVLHLDKRYVQCFFTERINAFQRPYIANNWNKRHFIPLPPQKPATLHISLHVITGNMYVAFASWS